MYSGRFLSVWCALCALVPSSSSLILLTFLLLAFPLNNFMLAKQSKSGWNQWDNLCIYFSFCWRGSLFEYFCCFLDSVNVIPVPSVLWHCWLGIRKTAQTVKKLSDEVLAWLSVWSEMQMICIWSSWCHCRPIISCFIKIQIALTFLLPAYPGCPEKEAVNWVWSLSIITDICMGLRLLKGHECTCCGSFW